MNYFVLGLALSITPKDLEENHMHATPSESSILRDLLEKAIAEKVHLKEKLQDVLNALEVECDVSASKTWKDAYHCGLHGTQFTDHKATYICPVGEFAHSLKRKNE